MDSFSICKSIISTLSSAELSALEQFIIAFDPKPQRNKVRVLLNALRKNPDRNKDEVMKLVSTGSAQAQNQIIQGLKRKLLEFLQMDVNVSRKGKFSDYFKARVKVNQRFLQANAIYSDEQTLSLHLIEEAILLAEKYELYHELIKCLDWQATEMSFIKGVKVLNEYEDRLQTARQLHNSFLYATKTYRNFFSREVDYDANINENVGILTEAIARLQNDLEVHDSAIIQYYLLTFEMEYYLAHKKYDIVEKKGWEQIQLIKENPSVYFKNRLGIAYSDLADLYLVKQDYRKCINAYNEAQKLYKDNTQQALVINEYAFFAHFHLGDIGSAQDMVLLSKSYKILRELAFYNSKVMYFEACLNFVERNFKKALHLLSAIREINQDKEGWNIGVRFLSIQCLIELHELHLSFSKIEALRIHYTKLKDIAIVRNRDEIILSILRKLDHNSYNFDKTYASNSDLFKKLSRLPWQSRSHELINFQQWFFSKVDVEILAKHDLQYVKHS